MNTRLTSLEDKSQKLELDREQVRLTSKQQAAELKEQESTLEKLREEITELNARI